jgi:hypothetical protein
MSFSHTIARSCYDRIRRDLEKNPIGQENFLRRLIDLFEHHKHSPGTKKSLCLSSALNDFEDELIRHSGIISLSRAKLAGKYYGKPVIHVEISYYSSEEPDYQLRIWHDTLEISPRIIKILNRSEKTTKIILSCHAIDRMCERYPSQKVRTDPNFFMKIFKISSLIYMSRLNEGFVGNDVLVPVPGGGLLSSKEHGAIVAKTYYGQNEISERSRDLKNICDNSTLNMVSELNFFLDHFQSGEATNAFDKKQFVKEAHVWIPNSPGMRRIAGQCLSSEALLADL